MNTDELFRAHQQTMPPFQRGSATSEAAAEAIKPVTGKLRKRVFEAIAMHATFGATRQEISQELGMEGDTLRPRWLELAAAGLIEKKATTRPTATGRQAEVWEITVAGIVMLAQSGE